MITVSAIENIDQIVCQKHNGTIELFSLEENVKVQDLLLCVDCIREKTRVQYSLPSTDVIRMIQEDQQKKANQFDLFLKPLIEQVQNFQGIIEKIRTQISCKLGQIIAIISNWEKDISQQRCNVNKYSLIKELENLRYNERGTKLYSIENKRQEAIISCNQTYLNNLQIYFKQALLGEELSQLSNAVENVFSRVKENFIEDTSENGQQKLQKTTSIQCLCPQHQSLITMINLDRNTDIKKRTLCNDCQLQNVIPISKFEERWKQYQDSLQKIRNEKLNKLQLDVGKTKKEIAKMKQQLMKDLNQIEILLESSIKYRISLACKQEVKRNDQNNLERLQVNVEELSFNETRKELMEEKNFGNYYYQHNRQLILQINKLGKQFNSIIEDFKKTIECQPLTQKLVNTIKEKYCNVAAFNHNGTIMASGILDYIIIWYSHRYKVLIIQEIMPTVQFSARNKIGLFQEVLIIFTVGNKQQIIGFVQILENIIVVVLQQVFYQTQMKINCYNVTMMVLLRFGRWIAQNNILTYNYSLNKHKSTVYDVSLNESETSLVSSSKDISIIIWGKGQLNNWEFKYYITKSIDDYGYRISFINDNMIAQQQYRKGITLMFQLQNNIFKERPDLQIKFYQFGDDGQYRQFPMVYNKERNILIQKHNKYVYILRQQHDGKFIIESEIVCDSCLTKGSLTNDGQHIVIHDEKTEAFRIYKIYYE